MGRCRLNATVNSSLTESDRTVVCVRASDRSSIIVVDTDAS